MSDPGGAGPGGELPLVDITYTGPPMTPWVASYRWASMLAHQADLAEPDAGDPESLAALTRVVLARAISIAARAEELTDDNPVPGPGSLSRVALAQVVWCFRAETAPVRLRLLLLQYGHHPTPREPGYLTYSRLETAALDDPLTAALGALMTAGRVATPHLDPASALRQVIRLGHLGAQLNQYHYDHET